jgi:hypothetical protein
MSDAIGKLFVPLVKSGDFIYAGGVKLFRLIRERGTIQFVDSDTRRAKRRGTPLVEVKISQVCELLRDESGGGFRIFYDEEGG